MRRIAPLLAFLLAAPVAAQTDYKTDLEHPRLLMPQRRARLVKRERERDSMRWQGLQVHAKGSVPWPEPGLALSLLYVTTEDRDTGRKAVDWALGPGADLRQLAIVFDWCYPLLAAPERDKLAVKISGLLDQTAATPGLAAVSARVLGALAISGQIDGIGPKHLKPIVEEWWKTNITGRVKAGDHPVDPRDHLALFEMFHAIRDNFDIDLRETAAKYFTTLPVFHIMAHYPAPYPGPDGDYRVPLMVKHQEPDTREATRSRAAAFAMVAYDNNSQEMQFVQGWLMQDRFLVKSAYGAPYEYLWANPYQPGLSFHYLPNVFHDPVTGRLLIRSTWEDDAVWYYQASGVTQIFRNGEIANLGQIKDPIVMGNTTLLPSPNAERFQAGQEEASRYYVIGLKPSTRYDTEVEDEDVREVRTDRGGVAELMFPAKRSAVVRMKPSPAP